MDNQRKDLRCRDPSIRFPDLSKDTMKWVDLLKPFPKLVQHFLCHCHCWQPSQKIVKISIGRHCFQHLAWSNPWKVWMFTNRTVAQRNRVAHAPHLEDSGNAFFLSFCLERKMVTQVFLQHIYEIDKTKHFVSGLEGLSKTYQNKFSINHACFCLFKLNMFFTYIQTRHCFVVSNFWEGLENWTCYVPIMACELHQVLPVRHVGFGESNNLSRGFLGSLTTSNRSQTQKKCS